MPVTILEHTADIRLRARGHSLQSAILELLNYILSMMYGNDVKPDLSRTYSIESANITDLVPMAINEVIYISESTGTAGKIRRFSICGNIAEIEYIGEKLSGKKDYGVLIKAATYYKLFVSATPPEIEVTLDI
ncbi:MAG: archease [Thermoplasmatales archaeon]